MAKAHKADLLRACENVYRRPEAKALLSPRWRSENNRKGAPASTGFCYIAAEALYHILKRNRPKAMCASYREGGQPCTHWWLLVRGEIIDPTATQYTKLGEQPPYPQGRGKGFLTAKPSKRAAKLIRMIRKELRS